MDYSNFKTDLDAFDVFYIKFVSKYFDLSSDKQKSYQPMNDCMIKVLDIKQKLLKYNNKCEEVKNLFLELDELITNSYNFNYEFRHTPDGLTTELCDNIFSKLKMKYMEYLF